MRKMPTGSYWYSYIESSMYMHARTRRTSGAFSGRLSRSSVPCTVSYRPRVSYASRAASVISEPCSSIPASVSIETEHCFIASSFSMIPHAYYSNDRPPLPPPPSIPPCKVWYHRNCANRGRNCTNRKTLSQGGCTMWYDEPSLLKAVETRLRAPIAELGPGYALPPGFAQQGGGAAPLEYGAMAPPDGGGDRARLEEHVQSLRPAVRELAGLEFEAQNIWLGMVQGAF